MVTSSKCTDLGEALLRNRQVNDRRQAVPLPCNDIGKIDTDNTSGRSYVQTGVNIDQIIEQTGAPLMPIPEEWLPAARHQGVAWHIIYGELPEIDKIKCEVTPYQISTWSAQGQKSSYEASMIINKALRHPPGRHEYRLNVRKNGWASVADVVH